MLKNAPLLALMPSAIMGSDTFTSAKVGSINDDLDGRAIQHAADLFNWHAPWLHFALNRVKEKHGIDLERLTAWLAACLFFAPSREPLLREGLGAWLSEDPVKAIHVLVPQIEAALRDLLAALGAPVIMPDPMIGGFRVLEMGKILHHEVFRAGAPKDFRFHLRALFSDPRGINLRNHVAHGLAHPALFNARVANWVIHSVLLIGTLRVQQGKKPE